MAPRRARELGQAALDVARKLLPLFVAFAFIGYLLNGLIPPAWISALFGAITGALTIARWKVVRLVVAVLWIGAIAAGYAFDILVAVGIA